MRWTATPARAGDQRGASHGRYFQVDMQAAQTFRQLSLDAAGSNGDYPGGCQVFVSNDGRNWGGAVATGNGTPQLVTISFPSQTARCIKVLQTGTVTASWWSIAQLNAYKLRPIRATGRRRRSRPCEAAANQKRRRKRVTAAGLPGPPSV
jgi:hypothetical protein